MADAVGDQHAKGTTDDNPGDGGAAARSPQPGADLAGDRQRDEHRDEGNRHTPARRRGQHRHQRKERTDRKGGGRGGRRLPGIGESLRVDT